MKKMDTQYMFLQNNQITKLHLSKTVPGTDFYAYRITIREEIYNNFLPYGPLFSQYLVDKACVCKSRD